MSRVGKMPVVIPAGVDVKVNGHEVTVKGPKGTLTQVFHPDMTIEKEGNQVIVKRPSDLKKHKALHGLTRTLINNMIIGVTQGYEKRLEINGVGYRAQKQGKKLILNLGFSHPVEIEEPAGITIDVPDQNQIIVKGIDKQLVGQVAAVIRSKRPPEPYKGKGIKYVDEVIIRKEGKTGAKK
ncbi:50S ribosomal protein L6 [Thermoclostridium stercorarium subsp. stercorarium DSM 8532]|uniref:Large ribosomal subunit protein uL6 n=1 Tax=Thermoclostridium stercorarium (strain ATCC 35414 / DSM 8532 / NCIMB 11754) TaxID=1121335 RepID=L7VMY2_THES1|nr:50S ribosomal protein L6 [Thermoclostridium stercorarium]AGC69580.1 50S ribosomal protein L6 [Thermoclostridium stercorarium subsp. stercorarium DSM 8532]AGI40531.1 ribosomal protein L6 [Thermoclostridium stercorarium subsp. stercorarium DSM 8532]UZQ85520.1 50S ribosomal protein L6 [Thermoclostridium stercorarium]